MMWATRLSPGISSAEFLSVLERHDFAEGVGAIPGKLAVYDQAHTGHRIVFVPRTGRIQIRLDALTRHEERKEAAHRVYEVLRLATLDMVPVSASEAPVSEVTDASS